MVKSHFQMAPSVNTSRALLGYKSPRASRELSLATLYLCGVNGETVELNRPINEDATVELYKFEDEEGKHTFCTHRPTLPKLFRNSILAFSLASVPP